jgi:hypothetical protein
MGVLDTRLDDFEQHLRSSQTQSQAQMHSQIQTQLNQLQVQINQSHEKLMAFLKKELQGTFEDMKTQNSDGDQPNNPPPDNVIPSPLTSDAPLTSDPALSSEEQEKISDISANNQTPPVNQLEENNIPAPNPPLFSGPVAPPLEESSHTLPNIPPPAASQQLPQQLPQQHHPSLLPHSLDQLLMSMVGGSSHGGNNMLSASLPSLTAFHGPVLTEVISFMTHESNE